MANTEDSRVIFVRYLRGTLCLILAILAQGCTQDPVEVKYRGQAFGTTWSVKVNSENKYSSRLAEAIQEELILVDTLMSNWKENSDVSRFNRSETETCTEVSDPTLAVVLVSQRISSLSNNAFDISLGPLVELWGFGTEFKSEVPTELEINEALAKTGLRNLYLTDNALCKRSHPIELNLSGVAKGYAVDRVANLLNEEGFSDYLVEVGGELRAQGKNGRGTHWVVGVEQPTDELGSSSYQTLIPLVDSAIATSGDYRNFYKVDDVRYSHIIDPVSGYPVTHNAASVTVLAKSSMEADAWATALLVLGPTTGMEIASKQDLQVLMILRTDSGFDLITSENWPQI